MIARMALGSLIVAFATLCWAGPPSGIVPLKTGSPSPYKPRLDAYIAGIAEGDDAQIERVLPKFPMPDFSKTPDVMHVIFLAKNRPVWLRITILRENEALNRSWQKHFQKLYDSWDRDGDGTLNRYELENIYGLGSFRQVFGGGFFTRASGPPPFMGIVDKDKDHRASVAELMDFYWPHVRPEILKSKPLRAEPTESNITNQLYSRLDQNGDGKLSEEELARAEDLLLGLDTNEDECVSLGELIENPIKNAQSAAAMNMTMNGMEMGNTQLKKKEDREQVNDLQVYQEELPASLSKQFFAKYAAEKSEFLSNREIAFTKERFAQLDSNKDGKLSLQELDAWRKLPPDAEISLDFSAQQGKSVAKVLQSLPGWMTLVSAEGNRLVLRVGSQVMDFMILTPPAKGRPDAAKNYVEGIYPENMEKVTEKDLQGAQYQYLRLVFDAADINQDGILTKPEAVQYFEMQRRTAEQGLLLSTSLRTPNLFELLDDNRDSKLSVRELRTAWNRLRPLEPGKSLAITTAIMQPCATFRLQSTAHQASNSEFAQGADRADNSKAPLWFRKMDRNNDGDVSRSEFLGSREDFDSIDTNHDQLISQSEAISYDQKARKPK
jgi:Ca2+-binding EF-hand superfamily protein